MSRSVGAIVSRRILSIQSHVVSGYCGNKAANFPLQLLGFEVDILNSVQLSNHTQYKVCKGQVYGEKDLQEIHNGLKENDLLRLYDHIISGYVADVGYIHSMGNLIADIKKERMNKNLEPCYYTLDPVLGDIETGFYVKGGKNIAQAYLEKLLPLADIVTPNLFELSALTGVDIDTSSSEAMKKVQEAIKILHLKGPKVVALTSVEFNSSKEDIVCILSYLLEASRPIEKPDEQIVSETWLIRIPKIKGTFYGTGDMFAALFTGWFSKTNFQPRISLENTVNTINAILEDTYNWSQDSDMNPPLSIELRIVQNQTKITSPDAKITAEKVNLNEL